MTEPPRRSGLPTIVAVFLIAEILVGCAQKLQPATDRFATAIATRKTTAAGSAA